MNALKVICRGTGILLVVLTLTIGQSAFALPIESEATSVDPGLQRGPVRSLNDFATCDWDYIGMRFPGTGGNGGYGTTIWPNGAYGGNYGQLCFQTWCEPNQVDPETLYAYCYDVDHALEHDRYCVNICSALVAEENVCSPIQLRAMAYLLAWCFPTDAYEDDILQLALWKLSTDNDANSATFGTPFFCIPDPINVGDTWPFENTFFNSNLPRNTAANAKILEALDRNVVMKDDQYLISYDPPVVGETESVVTVTICVDRGDDAAAVGNNSVAGILLKVRYAIGAGTPVELDLITDEDGCVTFDVPQPIIDNSYEDVIVSVCSNAAWPVEVIPCELDDKQDLLLVPDECPICGRLEIPGDNWLDVELSSFNAVSSANGVDLSWSTASETAVSHFEVERCVTGEAGFTVLATVNAHNVASGAQYTYLDRLGVAGRSYDYRLVSVDFDGSRTVHPSVMTASFGVADASHITEYSLEEAYPNPFNPSTTIRFAVPENGLVTITVYDISGREVTRLVNGVVAAGRHSVTFDGAGLSSGTYFYRMTAADFSMTRRIMLLK